MKKAIVLFTGIATLLPTYAQAKTCNVIVSSTKSFETAQKIQKDYVKKFDNVSIVKNKSGWFMISVAEVDKKEATKTVKKWKKIKKIPKDSLYSCSSYTKIDKKETPKVEKKAKKEKTKQLPAVVNQFNQASASYGKLKIAFIKFYDRTLALQAKEKSLTKDEKAEYAQRVQALKKEKIRLSQSFDVMANLYTKNKKTLTSVKDGNKVLPYLQRERAAVLAFFKKIEALK